MIQDGKANMHRSPISETEAVNLAHKWAVERGKNPTKFKDCARDCLKKFPHLDEQGLEIQLRYFDDACEMARALWTSYAENRWKQHGEYTLETVKHLAIVNGAGIAGTATLLNGGPTISLKIAILTFTAGLLLALLDFWLNSMGYFRDASDAEKRAGLVHDSCTWDAYLKSARQGLQPGRDWFEVAERVGWLSAVLFVAGAISLGTYLLT